MVQFRIRLQEYLLCGLLATYFETALCVGRSNDYNVLWQGFLVQEDFMPDSGVDVNYMMDEPVPHEGPMEGEELPIFPTGRRSVSDGRRYSVQPDSPCAKAH